MARPIKGEYVRKHFALVAFLIIASSVGLSADSWTDLFTLSAWGRAVVTPYAFSDGDSSVSASTFTGSSTPSIGIKVAGTSPSGKIGFNFEPCFVYDFDDDTGMVEIADYGGNAKAWVKPFNFLKITSGWFVEDDFRGTIGNTEFASWLLPNGGKDEDAIFTRFRAKLGAHVKLEPLSFMDSDWNGLMIEGAFGSSKALLGSRSDTETRANRNLIGLSASDVYGAMQIGLGYKVPEVGFLRVQFIGNNRSELATDYTNSEYPKGQTLMEFLSTNTDADVIEAAFRFTGIDGINVEVGGKIPLEYTTDTSFTEYPALEPNAAVVTVDKEDVRIVQKPYSVAVAVNWTPSFFEKFNVIARADVYFGGTTEEEGQHLIKFGTDIGAWLLPSYKVSDSVKAGVDMGMEIKQKDQWQQPIGREKTSKTAGSDYNDFGIGPWAELDVGGGRVRAGAMVMLPGSERWTWISGNPVGFQFQPLFSGDPVISFPISFTYSF
jgi:hypothetical protein